MGTELEGLKLSPLQWLEWLAENSGDMTISSMAIGAEVVVSQVAEVGAAALREQAERVRALEWERNALIGAVAEHITGARPMLRPRRSGRAEERRLRALEAALSALIVHFEGDELHDEGAFDIECPDCVALEAARALLPATQAEGEK